MGELSMGARREITKKYARAYAGASKKDKGRMLDELCGGWATSLSEYGDQMARCLQDAGFPAVSDGAGGTAFKPGVPPSQEAALDEAIYVCDARCPLHPAIAEGWSEKQVGLVYDYWDQYYIPCMEAHGHPV